MRGTKRKADSVVFNFDGVTLSAKKDNKNRYSILSAFSR